MAAPGGASHAEPPAAERLERAAAPIRARLDALRGRRDAAASAWDADLALVRAAAALGDAELAAESSAVALSRYGAAAAPLYRPEPPSVTTLTRLSVRSIDEAAFAADVERLHADAVQIRTESLRALKASQAAGDKAAVRAIGGGLNALAAASKEAQQLDVVVRTRLTIASRSLDAYRARCTVRALNLRDARRLRAVPPDRDGYEQILDFYRLTDASLFSFGRASAGPQHFTDIRRNVAILRADGCSMGAGAEVGADRCGGEAGGDSAPSAEGVPGAEDDKEEEEEGAIARAGIFQAYAVSGERAPGLNLKSDEPHPFTASACADGLGEVYMRASDAEFKLVSALCVRGICGGADEGSEAAESRCSRYTGTVTLWSKKPLCESCSAVVFSQFKKRLPGAKLRVVVDEEEAVDAAAAPVIAACAAARAGGQAAESLISSGSQAADALRESETRRDDSRICAPAADEAVTLASITRNKRARCNC